MPGHEWFATLLHSIEGTNLKAEEDSDFSENTNEIRANDDQTHDIAGLNGSHLIGNQMKLGYTLSLTRNAQRSNFQYHEGETSFESTFAQNLKSSNLMFRPDFESVSDVHNFIAGFEAMRSTNKVAFDIVTEDPRIHIPDSLLHFNTSEEFTKFAGFIQDAWAPWDRLELQGGVRWTARRSPA